MASLNPRNTRGYSISLFVDPPPEYIRCKVCRNVLRDPHLTQCCGRNVCHPCVEEAVSAGGPCPLSECRKPNVKVSFNRKCRNDIDECRVYCVSRENGCQWMSRLEKLQSHLVECGYVEVECPCACGEFIQRREVEIHQGVCKRFKLKCKCGNVYERQYMSRHMKVCELTTVKCPFNIVGCKVEIMNKDLPCHLHDSIPQHYYLVESVNRDMIAKVSETKRLIQQEEESKIAGMDAEIEQMSLAIVAAREKIDVLQQALQEGEDEVGELQRAQTRTVEVLTDQVRDGEAEIQALTQSFHRLHFDSKVKFFGPPIPRPQVIYSRPPEVPPTDNPLVPPLTFTILDFVEKKKYDAVVYSPPFRTHHGGYQICLQVYCNGDARGKGKWLSIYAYLMKGDNDDYLKWPFSGSITVEIRNLLKNTNHHIKTIVFNNQSDPRCEIRSRVHGDHYLSKNCLGYWNFMPFSAMFPRFSLFPDYQYVRNNGLRVDVSNVRISG